MTRKPGPATRLMTTLLMAGMIAACSDSGLPKNEDFSRLGNKSLSERNSDSRRTAQEAVNFFAEAPVTRLDTGGSNAFQLTTDPGQRVPAVLIGEINAAPLPFGALLDQISAQSSMSWRVAGNDKEALLQKEVYFVQRSEAMLETVLNELSDLTDAFYRVEGDRIIFSQDQLFVARVPRMANSQEVLIEGLGSIGATDIFSDQLSGTITFRATRPTYKAAQRLMSSLEQGRDMIVYDFWIIDRNLSDASAAGISVGLTGGEGDLDEMGLDVGGTTVVENLVGGNANGGFITGNLGGIGIDATVRLLRTLGDTETVARPTISMLSGGESSFSSGEKSEYIRSVNTESTDVGSSSGTDVQSLEVGVKIDIAGAHNSGVISTDFEIDVSELLAFEEFDTGEVTLKLPRTAQRTLTAHLEARPGDVMVLGGIIRERDDLSASELPGVGIPTQRGRRAVKTETIILVRPRLVQIRPSASSRGQGVSVIEAGIGQIPPEPNPISAVIIDEDQARDLSRRLKK